MNSFEAWEIEEELQKLKTQRSNPQAQVNPPDAQYTPPTSDSKTGKTAIIDIVDYCLGSGDFRVAEGVVRECVWWYAVRYQLKQGQILVARPNPIKYARSASDVYFLQGDIVAIPVFAELKGNINTDTLFYSPIKS